LKTLFTKSGPLISADFDKNVHGQYLGSATLVYSAASGAANCIRTYNGAQLDDRVMKIEYAVPTNIPVNFKSGGKALQIKKVAKTPGVRKGANAIGKNRTPGGAAKKAGKTLNLTGSNRRNKFKKKKQNSDAGGTPGGGKKSLKKRFNKKKFN